MRVLVVVGARPQFVKAAEFALACAEHEVTCDLVHTGQHYDVELSQAFFDSLVIPEPIANLEVGSGSHGRQTGETMRRLDAFLTDLPHMPDWMVVLGDTNSTLAAALVCSKRGLPIAHVEAGLRSFDNDMPEEINRVLTDRVSALLFCPTERAVLNLRREGIEEGVYLTGDVMYDSVVRYKDLALERHEAPLDGPFNLATIHRAENTDKPERLADVLECLALSPLPVLWPIHPRTAGRLKSFGLEPPDNVKIVPPVGYLEMLSYLQAATRVITDSGGVQKEAYWLGTPCITMRSTTEWPETLEGGWNVLVDVSRTAFRSHIEDDPVTPRRDWPSVSGAASAMVSLLTSAMDEN